MLGNHVPAGEPIKAEQRFDLGGGSRLVNCSYATGGHQPNSTCLHIYPLLLCLCVVWWLEIVPRGEPDHDFASTSEQP